MMFPLRYGFRNLWRVFGRTLALFGVLLLLVTVATMGIQTLLAAQAAKERIRQEALVVVSIFPREMTVSAPRFTQTDVQKALASPLVKAVGAHLPAFSGDAAIGGMFRADKLPDAEDYAAIDVSSPVLPTDLFGAELAVVASSAPHLHPAFRQNRMTISQGRMPAAFSPARGVPREVLLPSFAAAHYNLAVGDAVFITVPEPMNLSVAEFTLCGVYETEKEDVPYAFIALEQHFIHTTFHAFSEIEREMQTTFESLTLQPYDNDDAAALIRDAADRFLDLGQYEAIADDGIYKQITARLNEAYLLTAVFTTAILAFGFVLFLLLVLHFVGGRGREIGILRTLGCRPSGVLAVFASELTVITIAALIMGLLLGQGLAAGLLSILARQMEPAAATAADIVLHTGASVLPSEIAFSLTLQQGALPFWGIAAGALVASGTALLVWWRHMMRIEPMKILGGGEF